MMKMMLTIVMKNDNHEIDDNIDYEHDDMIRMKQMIILIAKMIMKLI